MTERHPSARSAAQSEPRGPSDYAEIRRQRQDDYGKKVHKFGNLSQRQYADPRHFLLELLQNAEDALARRPVEPPVAERGVTFDLTANSLCLRHFGDPFNRADVESICDFDESTKGVEGIGRFGLGFKSVYRFTDRPEVHSGPEDFVIRNYVWPESAEAVPREGHETVILLPRKSESTDWGSLADGLPKMLSGPYLLFLRHIESVRWSASDGSAAEYLRESEEVEAGGTDAGIRRVTLINGNARPGAARDEDWLIFERPVCHEGRAAGRVEIAFAIDSETRGNDKEFPIRSLRRSPLYAFFPTDKETHLGFHVQGPYNTTPARDNVEWPDSWNAHLVSETASLLRSALGWFRDRDEVSVSLLRCLPLEKGHFADTMFLPLLEETRTALRDDGLLPSESGPFVPASHARLGRGAELRGLFPPDELAALCRKDQPVHWLLGEITADRAPELRQYLQQQLGIEELDPESVVNRLTGGFLTQRSDRWILRLYEILADQRGGRLRSSLQRKPILRLDDGTHVCPPTRDGLGVFFPGETKTGFQTVGESVCQGPKARRFLADLGVREPDLVADVVENVLDKYIDGKGPVSVSEYAQHLERIQEAHRTDSREAQRRLIDALKRTQWVRAVDGSGKETGWRFPRELYLPITVFRELFEGIDGVRYPSPDAFDDAWMQSGGLLDLVGVARVLRLIRTKLDGKRLWEIGSELRGDAPVTYHRGHDWEIAELRDVLDQIRQDAVDGQMDRSRSLWDALRDAWAANHGALASSWRGEYHWSYSHSHLSRDFDAAFLVTLQNTAWVADSDGVLRRPNEVVFSGLDWPDDPALREKLGFLSDEDKQLREQDEMLTILEAWGVTTPTELRFRWIAITGSSVPDPALHVDLSEIAAWWSENKDEQRGRYHAAAFPDVLDVASLVDGDRASWFTFFALACFRSYGRTTDAQHRGFVDRGVREGWWTELAESRPPADAAAWLARLQAWSSADQTSEVFGMWRGSFVALYTVARWLDRYARLMLKLPDIIADVDGRVSLRELMDPAYSPTVRRLGIDAAPLARTLGIGANWMIRELLRAGVYRRGVLAPYAWMSSRRVRDFLVRAGGPALHEADPDHSRQIHEFVVKELGTQAAKFDGDYDLPLQLRTDHGWR